MKTLTELTDSTSAATWIPTEQFSDLILEASVCYGDLSGKITAIDYDLKAGQGDTVNIRYVAARTAQTIASNCGCLSATSNTLGEYTIDISKYGDYDYMCGISMFTAGPRLKDSILNEMAKGLAHARDAAVWAAIIGGAAATWTYTARMADDALSVVTVGGCCSFVTNLYNSIVSVRQNMKGACLNPDYVIMHPSVARYLYFKDSTYPLANLLKFDGSGNLSEIDGLKVIESGSATAASATSGATMAVVIDSSRCVGEVWGKRPTFTEQYVAECDAYKEVIWSYWGTGRLDPAARGRILNP